MKTSVRATSLRIQIKKQNIVSVDLRFPIFTLSMMDSLIPEKAQAYLVQSAIDIPNILKRIEDSHYVPQTVLNFNHDEKQFSIWIE